MNRHGLIRVRIIDLLPHELTRPKLRQKHIKNLSSTGRLTRPIIVHRIRGRGKYLILDGHHRAAALKELGYSYIIAKRINYLSPKFKVRSWSSAKEWDKSEVIALALAGKPLKPKSTKHVVSEKGKEVPFNNHLFLAPVINYPISALRRSSTKRFK